MVFLAPLVVNEVAAVAQSDTYTQVLSLAASVPENITVPNDQTGLNKAGFVVFGASIFSDYYARVFTTQEGTDRVTNGTFAEYVTNGAFASDTGWTKGTGWAIAAGVASATTASTALSQTSAITLIAGYTYTITYTVTRSAGTVTPSIGGTAGTARSSSATFTETIVAGSTQILAFTGVGFTGTVDNVSVTAWVLGTGWTTDGTTAIATGAISTAISQTANTAFPLVVGQAYLITYTITRSAGTITPNIGGTAGTAVSSSATFQEVIVAGSTQAISFTTSGFTGTLDNVIIQATARVPSADVTTGLAARQNPLGLAIPKDGLYVSVASGTASVITASFYQRQN